MNLAEIKKVSVIIPCRNEVNFIKNCIEGFLNQDYDEKLYEIIVCDGMSEDGTRDIVMEYFKNSGRVRLVNNIRKLTSCALNEGIKNSTGDLVIIFGAHGIPGTDFIRKNVEKINSAKAVCVGGKANTISFGTEGRAIAAAMSSSFGVGNSKFRYANSESSVDTVGFGGYRKSIFEEVGMFDEELVRNQDDELNFRIIKAGYKIIFSPEISYIYFSRSSYNNLWKQYYQYGFWKVRVMQKHGRPAAIRHLVPAAFVLSNLLLIISGLFSKTLGYLWLSEISSYLVLSFFMAIKLACSNKIPSRYIFHIMLVFPILHTSYGMGFIDGVLHFLIRRNVEALKRNTKTSRN